MLNQVLAEKLAKEQHIAPLNIIREHLEMEVLFYLSRSSLAERLIFYGGTALRLAHRSFRFSEDLDFLYVKAMKGDKEKLRQVLESVAKNNQGVTMEEAIDKRETLFGLLRIKHDLLKHAIRIKVEISKKKNGIKTENTLLASPTSNKEIIFPTATAKSIYELKIKAIQNRTLARDWFDFWYLSQKLNQVEKIKKKFPFENREFARELKRWLAQDKWRIIETVIKFYA